MVPLGVLLACLFLYNRGPVTLKSSFTTFPVTLGGWHQSAADASSAIFRVEEADDELLRTYRNDEGRTIQLYVAYLRAQRQGKEVVDYQRLGSTRTRKRWGSRWRQLVSFRSIAVTSGID